MSDGMNAWLTAIFQDDVSWHQNVSILDFIGAKDDGGKTPVIVTTHNIITQYFYKLDALPIGQPTASKH